MLKEKCETGRDALSKNSGSVRPCKYKDNRRPLATALLPNFLLNKIDTSVFFWSFVCLFRLLNINLLNIMDEITVKFANLGIEASLLERLNSSVYDEDEAVDAIHGRKLPQDLGFAIVRHCVIRGLRHRLDFAVVNRSTFEKGPAMFKQSHPRKTDYE